MVVLFLPMCTSAAKWENIDTLSNKYFRARDLNYLALV